MRPTIPLSTLVFLLAVISGAKAQETIAPRDCAEIRLQAEKTLERFALLLNQIADPSFYSSERNELIKNSFRIDNPGRIFFRGSVIIENDMNPVGSILQNTGLNDEKAERYLHDFDLLYSKEEEPSVFFSNLHFGPVRQGDYVFIHILYNSELRGRLKDEPERVLPRHKRVATIRAEKIEGQWRTYVLQINFYNPDFEFVLDYQDADCDGIVDAEDGCPEEAGSKQWNGCLPPPDPDTDGDGLIDREDECPDCVGPWCTQGCPMQMAEDGRNGPVLWEELLGNAGLDVVFDVTKNERGEIVFAGETEIGGRGQELYMAVFDPCRKSIRNRLVLGGALDDGARKIIQTDAGQYALAGYTESSGSGSRDAWLLLTDGTRKTGEKFFGTGRSSESFVDLTKDARGNLVFTGQKEDKIWLLQTDSEGNILREALYYESRRSAGTALALSSGGDIYLTGYEYTGNRHNLLVLHYDEATGRLKRIYRKPNAKGLDLLVDRAGQLVVVGTVYSKRTRDDIFAMRLTPQGDTLWDEGKTYGGTGIDVGCSVLETLEGYYMLAGYSSSYADGARREKLWANLLSPSGEALWETPLFLGDRFSERAYGITQIEANSVIAAGLSRSSVPFKKARKSDFYLISIPLNANAAPGEDCAENR